MIPYIAVLIVLIVAILFAVYKRVDAFEIGPFRVAENTTLQAIVKKAEEFMKMNETMLVDLKKLPPSKERLTPKLAKELGLAEADERPIPVALQETIELQMRIVKPAVEDLKKRIQSAELTPRMTVKQAAQKMNPMGQLSEIPFKQINDFIDMNIQSANARERFIKSRSSKKDKKNDMRDVFGGIRQAIKASTLETTDAAPQMSSVSTKELEDRIANRVAKQMKDSMLLQRSTEEVYGGMPCPYAPVTSNSMAQGQELTQMRPSPKPDMSEYIRKDSIPCWNCTLP